VAWCKAYLDGIQDAGVYRNDSGIERIVATATSGKVAGEHGVTITVREVA
jgi:Holliday junction resolvase RusA-like endonuclease